MTFVKFLELYGATIVSVIITIASLVIAFIKAKKNGNSKGMLAIVEAIPSLVTNAEALFGKGNGQAKLDYVLTQLRLFALQNNIKVDVNELTAQVNSVVATTKEVNVEQTPNVTAISESTAGVTSDANNNQVNINI